MVKVEIELPESAKEYLDTVQGKCAVFSVMMKDRRLLRVSYELTPRYDCQGNYLAEDATECPVCQWPV